MMMLLQAFKQSGHVLLSEFSKNNDMLSYATNEWMNE